MEGAVKRSRVNIDDHNAFLISFISGSPLAPSRKFCLLEILGRVDIVLQLQVFHHSFECTGEVEAATGKRSVGDLRLEPNVRTRWKALA